MKHFMIVTGIVSLLALACNQQPSSATTTSTASVSSTAAQATASSMSPEDLGTLGAQNKKQPNDADKLLAQHGLDAKSFASAIRKVSENPDQAKRYAAAYKSAS